MTPGDSSTTKFCPICHRSKSACKGAPFCCDPYPRTDWVTVAVGVLSFLPVVIIAGFVIAYLRS